MTGASLSLTKLLATPVGDDCLIPGLATRGKVTLVYQPESLRCEWLAHWIGLRASAGSSIGPFRCLTPRKTVISSGLPLAERQALLKAFLYQPPDATMALIKENLRILLSPYPEQSAAEPVLDWPELRDEVAWAEILIISDLRVLLQEDARDCDHPGKLSETLRRLGQLGSRAGVAVIVFIPQRSGAKPLDTGTYLTPGAVMTLAPCPSGPLNTAMSVVISRERSGPLDKVPNAFRMTVMDALEDGHLAVSYDFLPDDFKQERLDDRNLTIMKMELMGVPRKDLVSRFHLSESRISRVISELRAKLSPQELALLAQDAQAMAASELAGIDFGAPDGPGAER